MKNPFSHFAGSASSYTKARPAYPVKLLSFLRDYWRQANKKERAIIADVGCGTGIAARGMYEILQKQCQLICIEPDAAMLAEAERATGDNPDFTYKQGGAEKFYAFADKYFNNTTANGQGLPAGTTMESLASGLGLDTGKFNTCVSSEKYKEEIAKDTADGTAAGVSGTPGFIIGVLGSDGSVDGVSVAGAQDISVFRSTIDAQLAR